MSCRTRVGAPVAKGLTGGWSFVLRDASGGGSVNTYYLRVEIDPSDRLFENTSRWFMHPSKFPYFLRRALAYDGLEVTQR